MLPDLPPTFAQTRDALRALACYVISPARRARTGRIGLRAYEGGIATPPFDDGTRIWLRGDELRSSTGAVARVTTVAAAGAFLGIQPSPDPGVGKDLPAFDPDASLDIDAEASLILGGWYAFAQRTLDRLAAGLAEGNAVSEAQLWPEHFDLAVVVSLAASGADQKVNVGFSPGDTFHRDPYGYVGPHEVAGLDRDGGYWNAPFGAVVGYATLAQAPDPEHAASGFINEGLSRLSEIS